MEKENNEKEFLDKLYENNYDGIRNLGKALDDYTLGELNEDDVLVVIKESINSKKNLLELFNKTLTNEKKLHYISNKSLSDLVDFLFKSVNDKKPYLLNKIYNVSYHISKKKLDKMIFYSFDHLIDFYLKEINTKICREMLDNDSFEFLCSILEEFRQNQKNIQNEKKTSFKNGSSVRVRKTPVRSQPVVENKSYEYSPVPETILTTENMKTEDQIIEIIQDQISPAEFENFIKLFYLYYKNIISYVEFIRMNEYIFVKLDKNICLTLKKSIEDREMSRRKRSAFNIKNQIKEISDKQENFSYKMLITDELIYENKKSKLINKQYICIAHGNESAGNEDSTSKKRNIKNSSEEQLLKIEDEMHEFDVIIQQFYVAKKFVEKLRKSRLPRLKKKELIRKIKNMRILTYLYGKKANQIFELMEEKPEQILPILENRIVEKVGLLEKVKNEFAENNWKNSMKYNFYKALDVKSNSIKSLEKDKLVNKSLINELKHIQIKNKKLDDKIIITTTICNLVGRKKHKYFKIKDEKDFTRFWNPVIAFEIGNKRIMSDIAEILIAYIKIDKINKPNDEKKFLKLIKRLIMNYFQIKEKKAKETEETKEENPNPEKKPKKENPFKNLNLEEHENLFEKVKDLEKRMKKKKDFYYSDKLSIKLFENKIKDMIEMLSVDEKEKKQPTTPKNKGKVNEIFNNFIQSNSSVEEILQETKIKQDNNTSKIFFGSYPFYIFYRYFVFIYERFYYAYHLSMENLKSEEAYNLFKKIILYYLYGVLDYQNFEDILRMVFGSHSGVFLNFDKIFSNIFKIYKSDDFSNFVFNLNKNLFERGKGEPGKEDVLFAKSCFKFNSLIAQNNNRNYKSSSINSFNNNYNVLSNELLKFEFIPEKHIFIVHVVKSIFPSDGKDTLNTYEKFLETYEKQLNKDNGIKDFEEKDIEMQFLRNNISYVFSKKTRLLAFKNSGKEDVCLSFKEPKVIDQKKNKCTKLKKIKKFSNIRKRLFDKLKNN